MVTGMSPTVDVKRELNTDELEAPSLRSVTMWEGEGKVAFPCKLLSVMVCWWLWDSYCSMRVHTYTHAYIHSYLHTPIYVISNAKAQHRILVEIKREFLYIINFSSQHSFPFLRADMSLEL